MNGTPAKTLPQEQVAEIRLDIDRGRSSEAQEKIAGLMRRHRSDPELIARARCLHSESLELQGRHKEALDCLKSYFTKHSQEALNYQTRARVRVRLALAYNYTGDFPKAIGLLNSSLPELENKGDDRHLGFLFLAFSRIYRSINEYRIARDHALQALSHLRNTGSWRGLAESYFALALVELFEGEYQPALDHLGQVLRLIGDRPAAYLLGMTYTNLAAVCGFIHKPRQGLQYLEKAINYYETTEHTTNAIAGYNNLGVHLMLLGQWDRAESEFTKALKLSERLDSRSAKLPMVLDSLAELKILQGRIAEAKELLSESVEIAKEHGNRWYEWQSLRTLGRCFLAEEKPASALRAAARVDEIGEDTGDRQALLESHIISAEAFLQLEEHEKCEQALQLLRRESTENEIDLGLYGELEHLAGILAHRRDKHLDARQHFGRSVSIFEMLGDPFRIAVSKCRLAFALGDVRPKRAEDLLRESIDSLESLGAAPALELAKTLHARLPGTQSSEEGISAETLHALTTRLAESVASPELLLRELGSIVWLETRAEQVLSLLPAADGKPRVATRRGFSGRKYSAIVSKLLKTRFPEDLQQISEENGLFCRSLGKGAGYLLIAPSGSAEFPGGLSIEPLLGIAEIGLSSVAENHKSSGSATPDDAVQKEVTKCAFVYASVAMERVVEEIRRIRSSDVTVLVTGESGTGKELVAESIHQASARKDRVFVPFNCTAVPGDLADAYLFGYRKGSFTGAASDSPGVIRAASGGTLFIDEIGDLPPDIQPKLLRFLQEGEIQPLGETRPEKVDVRVIAATNAELEEKVASGLFREDLFYRLNVIRLRIPPLRTRRSDIPVLVEHYLRLYSKKFGRRNIMLATQTMDILTAFDWRGNVRQLSNEIQRIVARTESESTVTPEDLSSDLKKMPDPPSRNGFPGQSRFSNLTIPAAVESLERELISGALERNDNNISRSAIDLGITRRGLQLKLKRYEISAQK